MRTYTPTEPMLTLGHILASGGTVRNLRHPYLFDGDDPVDSVHRSLPVVNKTLT